ncbi:MAG TPA: methyltransferase domain-containing protein [Candidatus Thermoplasmatota archaeon]|nr:methyltransferase domain-containing protein [Candidatus Thermoplasmatota archaeon]
MVTTSPAARLVRFAGVKPGQAVLDVGCGTGVVALTARRIGARVTGLDLTPELLSRAKEHSGVPGYEDITWKEGDAEALPFADGEFDVVLSQFGHMFAPRPEVATREMLRVLRPGGTIAFSTWPPEHAVGKLFALVGKHSPPLPAGASPSPLWGDVTVVRERLGAAVRDLTFDRETMLFPALSVAHYREFMERTAGPVLKLVQRLQAEPQKLAQFRAELEAVFTPYFDAEQNLVRQSYLMTRATKV